MIIYGLREVGSEEFRYVGLTSKTAQQRLRTHQEKANTKTWHYPVAEWMRQAGEVEIVQLCAVSRERSRAAERRWVGKLHAAGHRLLNSHLMPRARETGAAA